MSFEINLIELWIDISYDRIVNLWLLKTVGDVHCRAMGPCLLQSRDEKKEESAAKTFPGRCTGGIHGVITSDIVFMLIILHFSCVILILEFR